MVRLFLWWYYAQLVSCQDLGLLTHLGSWYPTSYIYIYYIHAYLLYTPRAGHIRYSQPYYNLNSLQTTIRHTARHSGTTCQIRHAFDNSQPNNGVKLICMYYLVYNIMSTHHTYQTYYYFSWYLHILKLISLTPSKVQPN